MKKIKYRSCVSILLFNRNGKVLVAERNDIIEATWQLPQGGIELGETLKDAALREMREEIGIDEVKFLRESTHWIKYDLPVEVLNRNWKRSWQGQNVKAIGFLFTGDEQSINLATSTPEFRAWRWVELEEISFLIVSFKKELYENIFREFESTRNMLRMNLFHAS